MKQLYGGESVVLVEGLRRTGVGGRVVGVGTLSGVGARATKASCVTGIDVSHGTAVEVGVVPSVCRGCESVLLAAVDPGVCQGCEDVGWLSGESGGGDCPGVK